MGQFEYWLLTIIQTAFQRKLDTWPSTYFGGLNSIDLYLNHESYSPFLQQPYYLDAPMELEWRQDTADYVAEQLRRERNHEKRQVLVQELVWCEECGSMPGRSCTHEPSGVTDPANPSTNKYVVEVLNNLEKPIVRAESLASIEEAASRALRELQRMHDAAKAMMQRGGLLGLRDRGA